MSNKLQVGSIFESKQQTYAVVSINDNESLVARNLLTMEVENVERTDIEEILPSIGTAGRDLVEVDTAEWEEAVRVYKALKPLLNNPDRTSSDVSQAATVIGVSVSTAYRRLANFESTRLVSSLLRKARSDEGLKRIDDTAETVIGATIQQHYLSGQKKKISKVYVELERACHKKKIPVPHISTLRRRIFEIAPFTAALARSGMGAAAAKELRKGSFPGADTPYSVIQIDHTKVDIMLVDSKSRIAIGRPWITVAIDVFSRTVVGWYISFDPPGALATGICIYRAVMNKTALMKEWGVDYDWPCQGIPGVIHADNAKEFRGVMLEMACQEHGFDLQFRKLKKPRYGAHIERLQGTLMHEIHNLEGSTFSNTKQKGAYDSAAKASLTVDEFELWFAHLVLGVYHLRPHSGLNGEAPVTVFKKAMFGSEESPGIGILPLPQEPEKFELDMLPVEERTIQDYGIKIDEIEYRAPIFSRWVGARDPQTKRLARKFVFRRDPRNLSKVYFWEPALHRYFEIPYKNPRRRPVDLWRWRAAQKAAKASNRTKLVNEEQVFRALDAMEQIEVAGRTATKAKLRERERAISHKKSAPDKKVEHRETKKIAKEILADHDKAVVKRIAKLQPHTEVDY